MCCAYFLFFHSVLRSAVKDKTGLGPLGDLHFAPHRRVRCHSSRLSKYDRNSARGRVGFYTWSHTRTLHTNAATNSKTVNNVPRNNHRHPSDHDAAKPAQYKNPCVVVRLCSVLR